MHNALLTCSLEQLHYERFHHPHPRGQQKIEVLYLKSQGYPHQEITRLIRVTKPMNGTVHTVKAPFRNED
jgi:hypothetical protein